MSQFRLDNAAASDMTNVVEDTTIDNADTDGISGGSKENYWQNPDWPQYWGYFNEIPELYSAMLMKSTWVCGKGYTTDPRTTAILDHIKGWGKDTFKDILFNMIVIMRINGDAFAEIMRDKSTGIIINIKVLNPGCVKIVTNDSGVIIRYEQTARNNKDKVIATWKPEEMFHLSHNRMADQIHGISDIKALEQTILADNESFKDVKKLMHHQVKPFILWKLKTDDPATINRFIAKIDAARNLGEDMFIPDDEEAVSYEIVQLNLSNVILDWQRNLRNKFYQALGLPTVVFGSAGSTESGSKIEYLAHEQIFEKDQRFIEDQVWNQLYLRINLIPPVSLLENLQTDAGKDGAAQQLNIQQSDLTAGAGR